MPQFAERVRGLGTTIFTQINMLAAQHNAINLGQGAPNFDTPPAMVAASVRALNSGQHSQYAPGKGTPALREAAAAHVKRFHGTEIDPDGLLITSGATGGIFTAIMGHINPGDEVIVIEPFFDIYVPSIQLAEGVPVFVPLQPPDWSLDAAALRAAFTERTRAIIINTPNNPTGRVFNDNELALIAELCIEYDAICITDEVYEHLVYAGHTHTPIHTLPGMAERTLSVSSGAKTFSATGWKIGWVHGPPHLVEGAWRVHQLTTFAIHHAAQIGVAAALAFEDAYFEELKAMYTAKRDLICQGLDAAGMPYFLPEGAFYVMADFSAFFDGGADAFARYLIEQVGVAGIPPGSFYSDAHRHLADNYIRFSFCKTDDVIDAGMERLQRLTR